MNEVVVVAVKWSVVGSFLGFLKSVGVREMGIVVFKDVFNVSGFEFSDVDFVILGNVLFVGLG